MKSIIWLHISIPVYKEKTERLGKKKEKKRKRNLFLLHIQCRSTTSKKVMKDCGAFFINMKIDRNDGVWSVEGVYFFLYLYYLKEKKVELSSSTLPKQAVRKTNASVISWSDGRRPGTRSVGRWARCRRDEVRTGNKRIGSLDNTIVTVNDGGRVLYLFNAPAD